MDIVITSRQNAKVKELLGLRKRKERERAGVTLVEGFDELSTALSSGAKPLALYFCPELMGSPKQLALRDRIAALDAEVIEVRRDVFEKIAYRESPDGWLAVVPMPKTDLAHIIPGATPLLLVCEAVEKPGNLGAMLRTSVAAGADAVIAANALTDWGNPNIVRASKGMVFSVPVADASNEELLEWLRANNIAIVAATPSATETYTNVDMKQPIAILVGTENQGLSDFWLKQADLTVRIPMAGNIDSLNVATSAALLLYEAVRQRAG